MQVKVYAKLNLTLNVLGKKNGFHNIDSAVTSVDVFDVVSVVLRSDDRVTVKGLPQIPTEQNVAYRAACAFKKRFNLSFGVDITIEKNIPIGAGMGGSSADAAAVIYALCAMHGIDVASAEVHDVCAELGSDINYMLRGGLAVLRGKGDDVECGKLHSPMYFALTVFDVSLSAAEVYSRFDELHPDVIFCNNDALLDVLKRAFPEDLTECFNNHLQQAAASISNYASGYLCFCKRHGITPNMTGSGSAYYVAFNSEQSALSVYNLLNSHGFNTILCRSVPCGVEVTQK